MDSESTTALASMPFSVDDVYSPDVLPGDTDAPPGVDLTRFKIRPRKVRSDDCRITVGMTFDTAGKRVEAGEVLAVHEGEYVWVFPVQSTQILFDLNKFQHAPSTLGSYEQVAEMEARFDRMADVLSRMIAAWTWTDNEHEPLPQPYKHPEIIRSLEADELFWLLSAAQGETVGERKNDLAPSGATSMVKARRQKRRR